MISLISNRLYCLIGIKGICILDTCMLMQTDIVDTKFIQTLINEILLFYIPVHNLENLIFMFKILLFYNDKLLLWQLGFMVLICIKICLDQVKYM